MKLTIDFEFDGDKHILEFNHWIGNRPRWLKAFQDGKRVGRNWGVLGGGLDERKWKSIHPGVAILFTR